MGFPLLPTQSRRGARSLKSWLVLAAVAGSTVVVPGAALAAGLPSALARDANGCAVLAVGESVSTGLLLGAAQVCDRQPASTGSPAPAPAPLAPPPPAPAPAPAPTPISGARGIDAAYAPVTDVLVQPGELSQAFVDRQPEGGRIALARGVHRLSSPLRLRTAQELHGIPGASLNGSKVLTGWTASDGAWYVGGQTQRLPQGSAPGYQMCLAENPLCNESEDLFVDGAPLRQVAARTDLGPGRFWFDKAASRMWIGQDPAGRLVETTVAAGAVIDGRRNVVRNLVIEKFGNAVQSAAVHGVNMVIAHNVVRLNHGQGVSSYGGHVFGNRVVHNGQMGLAGGGTDLVVEDNEIAWNNTERIDPAWEAGGTKWARSTGLVVRNNWSHHNWGSGFTTDIDNYRTVYEGNLVEDNGDIGIMHEISYAAVIRDNIIRRNGQRNIWFPSRVGINITNSSDVEVVGNIVEDNVGGGILGAQDRRVGTGPQGPWGLRNLNVHHNTVRATGSGGHYAWQTGLDIHHDVVDRSAYYTSSGNRFGDNIFHLPSRGGLWFIADDPARATTVSVDWESWRRTQDAGSTAVFR